MKPSRFPHESVSFWPRVALPFLLSPFVFALLVVAPTTTRAAAESFPQNELDATPCSPHSALSRRLAQPGADGIDVTARSRAGGSLRQAEPGTWRRRARPGACEKELGPERAVARRL